MSGSEHSPPLLVVESERTFSLSYTLCLSILFSPGAPHPVNPFWEWGIIRGAKLVLTIKVFLGHLLV